MFLLQITNVMRTKLLLLVMTFFKVTSSKKMNILFLVSDDMRPELGSFLGPDFPSPVHPVIHTPNLDSLAAKSLLLKRAQVQQAICSPSRTSLLTGRRPDTTHVYDLEHYFRIVGGNFTTIPQYFKQQGYMSVGLGKIFHPGKAASGNDDPISWSVPFYHSPFKNYWSSSKSSWMAVTPEQTQDKPLPDTQITAKAIEAMRRLAPGAKTGEKPFFLAVGLHKPHLPFVFPEYFLKFYNPEDIHIPDNGFAPNHMPKVAWSSYGELRSYQDIKKLQVSGQINTTLPKDVVRDLRRAYYSSITYVDHLFGLLLDELTDLGLAGETIISFWGDHGWQLGEHGEWCKQTNFELATHAPMMVHVPGLTDQGIETEKLTEFVDLFPTLVEAAGFPTMPLCPEDSTATSFCTEGSSLIPLAKGDHSVKWKDRVFSQYPRNGGKIMGYSMRTDQYRYTEWVAFTKAPHYKPDWTQVYGIELYDHVKDPEENYNAVDDDAYKKVKGELSSLLHRGWRGALPNVFDDRPTLDTFEPKDDVNTIEMVQEPLLGFDIVGNQKVQMVQADRVTNKEFLEQWMFSDDDKSYLEYGMFDDEGDAINQDQTEVA